MDTNTNEVVGELGGLTRYRWGAIAMNKEPIPGQGYYLVSDVERLLATKAAAVEPPITARATNEDWMRQFETLLEDYVGAMQETAVFNATQRAGMTVRMARPRYRTLIGHVRSAAEAAPAAPERAFPERDQSKPAEQQGLFRKFDVRRVDGSDQPGGKHYGCRYYVLDLGHDQHAPAAMRAYAASCRATHARLADDIEAEFGTAPQQAFPENILAFLQGLVDCKGGMVSGSQLSRLAAGLLASVAEEVEPQAPAILEAISWHARERDDLTLEDAVKAIRFGWKEVRGRSERAMLLQLIDLMASAPLAAPSTTPAAQAAPAEQRDAALEEAAKVCDAQYVGHRRPYGAKVCADAIRALKGSGSTSEGVGK